METLVRANGYVVFALGTLLNSTLIWLIVRKSSRELRLYSRILLQVAVIDIADLVLTFLLMPVCLCYMHRSSKSLTG